MKQNKSPVALLKEMDQTTDKCEDYIFIDQTTENKENTLLGLRLGQPVHYHEGWNNQAFGGKKWVEISCPS